MRPGSPRGCQPLTGSPPPLPRPPVLYEPRKPWKSLISVALGRRRRAVPARARQRRIDCACAALILHLIRASFSSLGFLAAFKLSHKIYLLFHEYISSRQAQAFYIFTLYIFHGRLIAVSKAERGRQPEQTEPAAGGSGREAQAGTGGGGARNPWSPWLCQALPGPPRLWGREGHPPQESEMGHGPGHWAWARDGCSGSP